MVISQGDVCWAELPEPTGSGPGFRRPVVVVQGDALNRSRLATAVCIPLTSNLRWANAPGNVPLTAAMTGLPKDSVANATQIVALDRSLLEERVGRISSAKLGLLLAGINTRERMTVKNAIDTAQTAVEAVDNDSTDAEVSAADDAIVTARRAIAGATNVPQHERNANTGTVNTLAR